MTPVLLPGDRVYIAVPYPQLGRDPRPAENPFAAEIVAMFQAEGVQVITCFQSDNPALTMPQVIAIFRKPLPQT